MAIVKMQRVCVIGLDNEKEEFMSRLMDFGVVELTDQSAKLSDKIWAENVTADESRDETARLEEKISRLQAELTAEQQTALDAEKWVALIKQYANPTELTAELLNTLIEKIVIHEAIKSADGMRDQEIEIYYRFIGKID